MTCRHCGTEIADKALICYRCGAATTEPIFRPPAPQRSAVRLVPYTIVLVALLLLAVYIERTASSAGPRIAGWAALAIAVVVVALRARGR